MKAIADTGFLVPLSEKEMLITNGRGESRRISVTTDVNDFGFIAGAKGERIPLIHP